MKSATEQNLDILKIHQIFDEVKNSTQYVEDQEIVAFLGPTKAGKSTLINCLMGNHLICKNNKATDEAYIVSCAENRGPTIGRTGQSETSIPMGYLTIPGTDISMWDFPGFGDNKGTEQEIANAAAFERVIRPQKSVRFVLVVPVDMIKNDDPMPFFKLLTDVATICPNMDESFCIVATKSTKGTVDAWLEKALNAKYDSGNKENTKIVNDAKLILMKVLRKNHCIDFRAPVSSGVDEENFELPNKDKIISLIKDLKGTSVGEFPLVISFQAKHEILQLYSSLYRSLKLNIETVCDYFNKLIHSEIEMILKETDALGLPINSSTKLKRFKENKQTFSNILEKSTNFQTFFNEIKKNDIHFDSLAESVENFVFAEKLQNMYKPQEQRSANGEEEFFTRIQIFLTSAATRYSDLIRQSEQASAEERRFEQEWKAAQEREQELLERRKEKLEKNNSSVLEHIAGFLYNLPIVKEIDNFVKSITKCAIQ